MQPVRATASVQWPTRTPSTSVSIAGSQLGIEGAQQVGQLVAALEHDLVPAAGQLDQAGIRQQVGQRLRVPGRGDVVVVAAR